MKSLFTLAVIIFTALSIKAQNLTLTPGNQAKLNLPRLNYDQIQAIPSPESGSIVYDLTTNCIRYYNGTKWLCTDQRNTDFAPNAINAWKVSELNPVTNFSANSIAVDNQGNIYVTGFYGDGFKINGTTYPNLGYGDFYIVKYNNLGVAQWVKTGGAQGAFASAGSITIDNQGNVFFIGSFYNTLVFGGNSYPSNNSSGDVFICKLSVSDGSVLAMKVFGGSNWDSIGRFFVDNQGNVYVTGTFIGSCNFDSISLTGIDNSDIYIAKCNSNLQFQWASKIVGVGGDFSSGISGDNEGNVYIIGVINSDATFAPGVTYAPGNASMFVAKYNATNGNYIWHKNQVNTGFMSSVMHIVLDSEKNVYIGGNFNNYIDLGGGALQLTGSGVSTDLFIAKISKDGIWQWAQKSVNNDAYEYENLNDFKINEKDELFIICKSLNNSNLGFGSKRYQGYNFVFKFDKNGIVKGGNVIQSTATQYVNGMAISGNYYYLAGFFDGSIAFDNISLSSPGQNGFIAKFVE